MAGLLPHPLYIPCSKLEKKETYTKSEIWKTLLVFTVGFSILSFLFKTPILAYVGTGVGLLGLVFPMLGTWFAKVWMKFAGVLGKINGTILLSVVFFLILFPLAFMQRIFSKNPQLKIKDPPADTNFIERNKIFKKEDLEKMW